MKVCCECGSVYTFYILFDVCKCDVFMCLKLININTPYLGGVLVVVECSLFLLSGYCIVCFVTCKRVDVWFSSVCIVVVCFIMQLLNVIVQPVAMCSAVFCSFIVFVVDAIGDHIVACSSIGHWSCYSYVCWEQSLILFNVSLGSRMWPNILGWVCMSSIVLLIVADWV